MLKRKTWCVLGVVLALVVIIHAALPFAVRRYVSHTLNKIPGYRAEVGPVWLNLFRGTYQIRDIKLVKIDGKVPVPFFSASKFDLSVEWSQLFHGAVVGEIELDRPQLNFVNSPSPETSQTEVDKDWVRRVKELFPLKINRFEVQGGEIHFWDFHRSPNVDIYMTNVHMLAVNLTNSRRLSQSLVATIDADGFVPPTGRMKFHLEADPLNSKPTFQLAAEMTEVDLPQWNNFLQAYGGVDAVKGTFSVFTEMEVKDGAMQGYIKPIFQNVEIARWKEAHENPLKVIWKAIVAGVVEILKNQPKEQIATRVPLTGNIENPEADVWATVGELLRNAFIQALFPGLEGFVR